MNRRIGKIKITADLIQDMDITEMLKATSKFVVVRCEHLYVENVFEYTAISPEFDEISPEVQIPYYTVELKSEVMEEGKPPEIVEVKFIRQI